MTKTETQLPMKNSLNVCGPSTEQPQRIIVLVNRSVHAFCILARKSFARNVGQYQTKTRPSVREDYPEAWLCTSQSSY